MSSDRRRTVVRSGLGCALWLLSAIAAAQAPTITISDESVVETDAGTSPMVFQITLSAPSASDVTGSVELIPGTAQAPGDFVDGSPYEFTIPAGTTYHEVTVAIVGDLAAENDENFYANLVDLTGAQLSLIFMPGQGTIVDDEPPADPPYAAIDDRYTVVENTTMAPLNVLANDVLSGTADGTLTLLTTPGHGTATLRNDIAPQYIEYRPVADFSGEERLGYRYCKPAGSGDVCDEGEVHVVIRPFRDVEMTTASASSWMTHRVTDLRALPEARFDSTALAAPALLEVTNGGDPTPASPWDTPSGTTWDTFTFGGGPAATVGRVLVQDPEATGQAIVVGVDDDGDGNPSADEADCFIAQAPWRCDIRFDVPAGESVGYWVLVQNITDSTESTTIEVFEIHDPAGLGSDSLHATGPGHVERGEDFDLLVSYSDDTIQADERRAGFVTFYADGDVPIGEVPVIVDVAPVGPLVRVAAPLVEGRVQSFELLPGELHRATIIDVPAGASRLRVTSQSAQDIDLFLVPLTAPTDPADTSIANAPPVDSARAAATGPGGNHVVEVVNELAIAARWYVVVRNNAASIASYSLVADIEATAPIVRDGSYFNPDRSGSGVFLYPAADQWTGLWYTYLADGTPTWYYLQAPLPGADGLWHSGIYRSAWDGDSNVLVEVGDVVLTPHGADRFQMTYRLDGIAGTQPLESFGRGCPLGGAVDLSSSWYDPARAGTGYSVQLFPDYEYYAAYYYDEQGIARFVAAELGHYGGSEEELVLQQLDGTCPTCVYDGLPGRTDIGVLKRRVLSGTFDYISSDLEFESPLVGSWTATDFVVPLGGPDTTQGCDP